MDRVSLGVDGGQHRARGALDCRDRRLCGRVLRPGERQGGATRLLREDLTLRISAHRSPPTQSGDLIAMQPGRLHLLGEVAAVTADGVVHGLSSPQARVAAARLVLERRRSGTSRRELAETIWPGELPDTWASALRSVVTRVRRLVKALSPEVSLEAVGGRYLLRIPDGVGIDLEDAVDSLVRAGEALADGRPADARALASTAAAVFENGFLLDHDSEWADGVRRQLGDALVDAYDLVARAALGDDDPGAALGAARALIDRAPLRESGYRALMQAHLDSGNRGESLATYAQLRTMLSDELGIDPSPETEDLYFRLLSAGEDPEEASVAPRASDDRLERDSLPAIGRTFVGRVDILDELGAVWSRAAPGRPTMAMVTGELGLGKTSVVTEFAHRMVNRGALVIVCVGRGGDRRRSAIVQALVEQLPHLEPSLRRVVEPLMADAEASSLVRVLRLLAGARALLLVVDDLDQVDEMTLDVVQSIFLPEGRAFAPGWAAQEGGETVICVIATAESSRLDSAALRLLHETERYGAARRIPLPRFGVLEAHDFVSTLPAVTRENSAQLGRLLTASGGNPYLFARLVETDPSRPDLVSTLVGGLRDYTRIRTLGLGRAAARLIRSAAVAGPVFDVEVVGRAADLGQEEVVEALEELVRFELVSPDDPSTAEPGSLRPEEYRFVHGALCDAIYADLAKTEKTRIHRRITEELALRETIELPTQRMELGLRATSTAAAPKRQGGAVELRWRAADYAVEVGDVAEAIRLRTDALELVPNGDDELRTRALAALGVDELRIGSPQGRGHLLQATLLGLRGTAVGVALSAATSLVDDLASDPRGLEDARSTSELVFERIDRFERQGGAVLGVPEVDRPLGRFLARHLGFGATTAPPGLLRHGVAAVVDLASESTHPLKAEARADLARELAILARAADDADALVLAAHHGASAAAVRHCPEESAEFDDVWREAMLRHPDPRSFAHLCRERELVEATNGNGSTVEEGDHEPGTTRLLGALAGALGGDLTGRQRLVARWLGFRDPGAWSSAGSSTSQVDLLPQADACLADVLAGRLPVARSRLRMMLTLDTPFALDDASLHDAAIMAIVAAETTDGELIGAVRERLRPVALVAAGHGYRTGAGPVAFHLARLAIASGDLDDAERLFLSGLTSVARSRSRVWVAAHQLGIASVLEARRTPGDMVAAQAFRHEARRIVDPRVVRLGMFDRS
ncbi:hypothetical protein C5C18_09685 [Rathayibacter tritici]|nr:hypothetical protein C5C21_09965 [Rathayibacter tritici]PPG06643.1 hypothetical protein C5C18_09685 [Rathayibacter tritici]